jgi:hypothetical protein
VFYPFDVDALSHRYFKNDLTSPLSTVASSIPRSAAPTCLIGGLRARQTTPLELPAGQGRYTPTSSWYLTIPKLVHRDESWLTPVSLKAPSKRAQAKKPAQAAGQPAAHPAKASKFAKVGLDGRNVPQLGTGWLTRHGDRCKGRLVRELQEENSVSSFLYVRVEVGC